MSIKKKMVSQNLTIIIIFLSIVSSHAHIEPTGHNSQITQTKNETQTQTQTQTRTKTVAYIESACQETRYPDLCIRSLSTFAKYSTIDGPDHLAHIALSVSLTKALQTRGYLLKVVKQLEDEINNPSGHVYLTIQDCVQQINDSVDQLSQAIKELRRVNNLGKNIDDKMLWHISNVETWVSTALTDASYCVQSFPGYRMSKRTATIKVKAQNVAEVTSNGLALFHRYAVKYRAAARSAKKP